MKINPKKEIGWFNNKWDSTYRLSIPIRDRGLNLGDGIFETVLILKGKPQLLKSHLNRWRNSADILGMASPPEEKWLVKLINEGLDLLDLRKENGALRINWSRGNSIERGINIPRSQPQKETHHFWLELNANEPKFEPISALISRYERRNANSKINHCKTFAYTQAIQARQEAHQAGFDDGLLLSTNGTICCGTTANLIIRRNNQLFTPHLTSGCIPGIMRQQGLDMGLIQELALEAEPKEGDQWLLINSLSCQPIIRINNIYLDSFQNYKELWYKFLGK